MNPDSPRKGHPPLPPVLSGGVRVVAMLEATKGSLVLLAGMGAFTLVHHDVQAAAEHLVRLFHLNPASHYPQIFIDASARISDARLMALAGLAFLYASMRFIEAYGLWGERRWAEWFAALSGGIYVPIEIFEVLKAATWPRITLLAVNLAIVLYMAMTLWRTRRRPA